VFGEWNIWFGEWYHDGKGEAKSQLPQRKLVNILSFQHAITSSCLVNCSNCKMPIVHIWLWQKEVKSMSARAKILIFYSIKQLLNLCNHSTSFVYFRTFFLVWFFKFSLKANRLTSSKLSDFRFTKELSHDNESTILTKQTSEAPLEQSIRTPHRLLLLLPFYDKLKKKKKCKHLALWSVQSSMTQKVYC
jgi:hypothetical protein